MKFPSLSAASLVRRFAIAAAMLATAALLLIMLSSWWLIGRQHQSAVQLLNQKEAEFHASAVSSILYAVSSRLSEVADSSILATGLVDSVGRETYLTPYLNGIRQVNGVPVQIMLTDFEGKEISSNGTPQFSDAQLKWFREQIDRGKKVSLIFEEGEGPELVAVAPVGYTRTQTPEGALLYKLALKDLIPPEFGRLIWKGQSKPEPAPLQADKQMIVSIDAPLIFKDLDLRFTKRVEPGNLKNLMPQYGIFFMIALALAGGVFIIGSRLALTLTRDLRKLQAFSSAVVKSGFGAQRADVAGSTEVAGLALSINHMLDRLNEQHAQLQFETQRFHQLANTIPHLAWMAHPDGWLHWYNDRWYEYTGTTPAEMQGWGWQSVHRADLLPQVMQAWQESVATGVPFEMTTSLRAATGEFRKFFTRAIPLRDASGKIVHWFGTNTDVTPLEKAENALRKSQERLNEGMVAARMVVWDWDLESGRTDFSDNVETVLGGSWNHIVPLKQAIHPEDVEPFRQACREAIAERREYQLAIRFIRPDNGAMLWLEVRGKIQCDANAEPQSVSGICLDITERRKAEDELREADRRKDEFLAMLAHELRNPLAPISAAAQVLKLVLPEHARVSQTSEIISRQVDHMTRLVDDLLDVSRVTRGLVTLEHDVLDIRQIVDDAAEQVRPLIRARGQSMELRLPPESAFVTGDHKRLVQVFANILNNAAKYTPEDGHILLSMEVSEDRVSVSVSDNGIGIDPKMLLRVFDLFTQAERSADRSQGGLGLGLALVKKLAELHGGSVVAHSEGIGTGATFTIHLPQAHAPDMKRLALAGGMPVPRAPKSLRLMVVDDNHDAAQSLAIFLQAAGHQVAVEYGPYPVLDRASTESHDVYLLDIGLPGMDGNELARRIRSMPRHAQSVFIAITGYGHEYDRKSAAEAGFDHYFVKPADPTKLAALLAEISMARMGDSKTTQM